MRDLEFAMMPAADARLRERSMTAPAGSAIRRSALPRSTNWRLKKSCVGAPPPLRVGAEEGDHATPGRDPGGRWRGPWPSVGLLGRCDRPEKSLQTLEKAQNGLGHVKARWDPPEVGPNAASPQIRRPGSCRRPEKSLQPLEKAQNRLGQAKAR